MEWLWAVIPAVVVAALSYWSRVIRVIAVVLLWISIFVFPAISTWTTTTTTGSSDTSVIQTYDLVYDLEANGDLALVETLNVKFTETKHGIFRFFDETDDTDPSVRHPVTIRSVERCTSSERCVSEPFTTYYEDGNLVAKIGSAAVTYPLGTVNRYRIKSVTKGAITTVPGSSDYQWYWDVIGGGWAMQIQAATVTAHLPAAPIGSLRCATDAGSCSPKAVGDNSYTLKTGPLPPRSPVTWQAMFAPKGLTAVPVKQATPAPPATSAFSSPLAKAVLVLVGAAVAVLLFFLIRSQKERKADEAPAFAVPGPDILALTWTLREEPIDDAFQALLLDLSATGVVQVTVDPSKMYTGAKPDWIDVTRTQAPMPVDVTGADKLLTNLGLVAPGSAVRIESKNVATGKIVQLIQSHIKGESTRAALAAGYAKKSGSGFAVHLVSALLPSVAFVALIASASQYFAAMFAIPAIAGLWSNRDLVTTLSYSGLRARDAVAGLRTSLSTQASVERFDYALKVRYFLQFLPWAVALGCAEAWAEACKPDAAIATTDEGYRTAMAMYYGGYAMSFGVTSVSASAVAAYSASQSSSGGGGGFSSGGGSGGGGGGSW